MPILFFILVLVVGAYRLQSVRNKKRNRMLKEQASKASADDATQQSEYFDQAPAAYEPASAPVADIDKVDLYAQKDWSLYEMPTYLRRAARQIAV